MPFSKKKRKIPPPKEVDDDNDIKQQQQQLPSISNPDEPSDNIDDDEQPPEDSDQDHHNEDNDDDTPISQTPPTPRPPNPYDDIKRIIVRNDNKRDSLIRLIGLKSLFAKQLPKMPKEYIARLVFDRRHTSLALLDPRRKYTDDEIIGGICYRAYPEMRFAEIAFCAVSASQQVKGYGTKLMNLLKMHAVKEGIEYMITYADNYAIGYFKKQGFTKAVQMPKARYQGLIKDYDGGTIMECYIHPNIDYTRIPEMVQAQKEFILQRVTQTTAKSDKIVYPPLPRDFSSKYEESNDKPTSSKYFSSASRALSIPGVKEAGWTLSDLITSTGGTKDSDQKKDLLKKELLSLVQKVQEKQFAWCFRDPVDTSEVTDYLDTIQDPIDLRTIEKRVRKGDHYKSKHQLYADMMKMVNNCKIYNGERSNYYGCAVELEKYLSTLFPLRMEGGNGSIA